MSRPAFALVLAALLAAVASTSRGVAEEAQQRQALLTQRAETEARAEASAAAAEAATARAEALGREREELAARLTSLGDRITARERALEGARTRASRLRRAVGDARVRRTESRRRLQQFIGRALRAAREPTPSLLAHPERPVHAARAAMLMRRMAATLRAAQAEDQRNLDDIAAATAAAREVEAAARSEIAGLLRDETELRALLDQKAAAEAETRREADKASKRAAELGRKAQSLDDLARSVAREPTPPAAGPSAPAGLFAEQKGRLRPPAVGEVAPGEGAQSSGVYVATRPFARVIAPWGGVVRFADAFMSYGRIVIIEPQKGYSLVISGLDSVEVQAGQQVATGQPIGRMGGPQPTSGEFMLEWTGEAEAARETLFFEVWRDGEPLDAAAWLRAK